MVRQPPLRLLRSDNSHAACYGFTVLYARVGRLLEELKVAHRNGSFSRRLPELAKLDVLLIDAFALAPITPSERNDLLELLDDGVRTRSTIITSQLPVNSCMRFQ